MKTIDIHRADVNYGMDVCVHLMPDGHSGQGGLVTTIDDRGITVTWGDVDHPFTWDRVHHLTAQVPFDADECLEYGSDCSGPVDYHWTGGQRSWPRCTFHGERRRERYENSLERYVDSDVVPDWFDPADAGERWEDDY